MANLLSFLGNQIRGAVAQANQWDGGATYASVTRKREEEERRRQAQQAQQRQTLNRQPQGLMQPPTLLNQQSPFPQAQTQKRQLFQQPNQPPKQLFEQGRVKQDKPDFLDYLNPMGEHGLFGQKQQQNFQRATQPVVKPLERIQEKINATDGVEGHQWTSPGDYARFAANLLPGMAQGIVEAPNSIARGVSGMNESGNRLNALQRVGNVADGAISVAGLPMGGSGVLLKSLVPGANRAAAQGLRGAATGLAKSSGSEAVEEMVQTFAQDLADNGQLNARPQDYAQAAAMGALGGGMMHGGGKYVNSLMRNATNAVDPSIRNTPQGRAMVANEVARQLVPGGTIAGRNASGFADAQNRGLVFDGVDGKQRFEVDDSVAKIKNPEGKTLGEMLDHPELFKNYPDLENLKTEIYDKPLTTAGSGYYDYGDKTLAINKADPDPLDVILHEVQHAIQDREGFPKGASPSYSSAYKAELFNKRYDGLTTEQRYKIDTAINEQVDEAAAAARDSGTPLTGEQKVTLRRELHEKAYGAPDPLTKLSDFEIYRRSAGEAEARAVAARKDMPMSERYVAGDPFPDSKVKDTVYHQTDADFTEFQNTGDPLRFQNAHFFLDTKPDKVIKKNLIEAKVGLKNPKVLNDTNMTQPLIDELRSEGYDGVINNLPASDGFPARREVVVFDGKNIKTAQQSKPRSTFYDSLDVPKKDLIVRNDTDKANFIERGRTPSKIHPDDQTVMAKLIDHADKIKRLTPDQAHELEIDAARVAERYGIDVKWNKSESPLTKLAQAFRERLDAQKYEGVMMSVDGPLRMTEEEYLARNGAPFMGGSEPALQQNRIRTKRGQSDAVNKVMADMSDNNARRAELKAEYKKKVESGEIVAPTAIEERIRKANGNPDLKSTQAARRVLEKQGIDWQQSTPASQAPSTPTPQVPEASPLDSLKAEARKYKSAEEFVKAQGEPVYHRSQNKFDKFDISKVSNDSNRQRYGWGLYFSDTIPHDQYGKHLYEVQAPKGTLIDTKKPVDEKIVNKIVEAVKGNNKNPSELVEFSYNGHLFYKTLSRILGGDKNASMFLSKNGIDGLKSNIAKNANDYILFDDKSVQTKQQLTDLYNQAHAEAKAPAPQAPSNPTPQVPKIKTSELVRRLTDASDASRRGTPSETSAQPKPKSQMPRKQSAEKKSPKPVASPPVVAPTKSKGNRQSQTGQLPDTQNSDRSSTNNATKEDVRQYVDGQVRAQQVETKVPLKQMIDDFMAVSKHTLVDDAVAHERYIKDKRTKAELREGVDRVRGSSMMARQFAEDNGMNMLGKMKTDDLNDFQQYLIAKRSMELKAQNIATGRSHQMDQALIKQVGNKYAAQEKMIRDYAKSMLDYSVENGLISKELRDNLLETSKSYVPMNRVMDTVEGSGVHKSRQLGSLSKQTVVQKIKGSERIVQNPIESLLLNTERMVNEAQRNNVASRIAGIDTIAERVLKDGDTVRPGYDTLSYLDKGKKVRVEVPALVAKEMRNLNSVLPDWATTTMKIVGTPTQLLRTGATSANPVFAISNLVRDQLQTAVTGNVRANIKGTPKAMVAAFSPRKGGQKLRAELRRNGIIGSEYRQTYGFKSGELMGELQANNQFSKVAWERMRHPIDALADIISTTENFTRAQQFYGTKGDITTRSQAARNNTLNFGRAGVLTRQLNRVIPFLNAGVQGGRIGVKSFKERPYRTTAAVATFAGVALAAKALNNSINDELYDRLSDDEKKNNIIWFMPGAKYNPEENRVDGLVKIPMPQMLYPVLDAVNNIEGKPEDLLTLAGNIFTATTGLEAPVDDGKVSVRGPINQLTPTAVKPAVEAGLNKNLYTGQDLISEYEKNENPEDMGRKYTTGVARTIAKHSNIPAPIIDSIVGNWGGGLAKDLSKGLSDNPDNTKDGGGLTAPFKHGGYRRFGSSAVTSQYEIQETLAESYKKQLKNDSAFTSLPKEEQTKMLDKIDVDTRAIAGVAAKTEQGKSDEIKRDLTSRQKSILESGFSVDSYMSNVEAGANNGVKIASGISKDSVSTLETYNSMSSDDRKKTFYKEPDAEFKYNLAKYENDLASGTLSTAQRLKKEKSLEKDQIGSVFPKEVRDLYSLSKADLADYLTTEEKGVDKKKLYDQLVAYDQALNNNGLASSLKFKYGLGSAKGGSKGGGKGSKYSTSQLAQAAALRYSLALAKPKVAGGTAMPKGGTRAVGAIARANLKKSRPTSELVKLATVKVGKKVKR